MVYWESALIENTQEDHSFLDNTVVLLCPDPAALPTQSLNFILLGRGLQIGRAWGKAVHVEVVGIFLGEWQHLMWGVAELISVEFGI